jgi:hypothetical protein
MAERGIINIPGKISQDRWAFSGGYNFEYPGKIHLWDVLAVMPRFCGTKM